MRLAWAPFRWIPDYQRHGASTACSNATSSGQGAGNSSRSNWITRGMLETDSISHPGIWPSYPVESFLPSTHTKGSCKPEEESFSCTLLRDAVQESQHGYVERILNQEAGTIVLAACLPELGLWPWTSHVTSFFIWKSRELGQDP